MRTAKSFVWMTAQAYPWKFIATMFHYA